MAAAKKPAKPKAKAAARKTKRTQTPAQKRAAAERQAKREGQVVSVFGAFNSRVLIDVPAKVAAELFSDQLAASGRTNAVDAVHRDLERLRKRAPELAESALAAAAERMAYELEHPFNSATSRSMCARALYDAMAQLEDLAPDEEEADSALDQLAAKRAKRLAK